MSVDKSTSIRQMLEALSEEERELLGKVIVAERAKLHMKLARNIKEDLWKAVEDTIR
jgi:hypothetical protein